MVMLLVLRWALAAYLSKNYITKSKVIFPSEYPTSYGFIAGVQHGDDL
jgi:hypothetical protein